VSAARVARRPVIVLTAAVLGLGAAGGITGMALGGIGAAVSDRVSEVSSDSSPGPGFPAFRDPPNPENRAARDRGGRVTRAPDRLDPAAAGARRARRHDAPLGHRPGRRGRLPAVALALVAIVGAAGSVVTVYRIGDSGARAAWTGRFSATPLARGGAPVTPG
jgi:hypothetical protein